MGDARDDVEIDGPAAAASAAELSRLGAETFTQTFGHLYDPRDLNAFLRDKHAPEVYQQLIDDPAYGIWVVRDESGAAFGYAVAGPCDLPVDDMPDRAGELVRLYLLQEHRGGGVGGRMLNLVLEWLENRFDAIYLSVYSENTGAQRLYARYGFGKVQEYVFMVGDHPDPEFILKRNP